MKNNFCPSCGAKLENNPNFCSSCGEKLESTSAKKSPQKTKKTEPPKKSNSYFILALAFLFAIVTIILVNNSNTKSFQKKLNSKVSQTPAENPDLNRMMNTIQELRKQLDADPSNYELNVKMGNSFFDISRFPDAIKHYQKALEVNATDPNVLIDLGVAYFNTNSSDSALMYMQTALKIDPTHSQGLYNSGIVHFNMGDSLGAIKMWEKLIETNSQSPQAATAKKFIDQIKSKITKS
ncbi:MAG: tetratricopeptide repeat protein [Calditrichaeota bacterium]|nr:tetratricopeptide repeat protein [Calditrichota bacterium]